MRYPVQSGLALPPQELGFDVVEPQRRLTNNHHAYWEKSWYQDKRYRKVFRGLISNVYTLYIPDHDRLHEQYSPPVMPRDSLMIDVVEEYLAAHGVIECVREQKTSEIYQIGALDWHNIKSQYRGGHGIQEVYQHRALRAAQ